MKKGNLHYLITVLTVLILMLGIVSSASAQEPGADLALTEVADQTRAKIGENITLTITVTNLGPDTATGIYFGDSIPDPLNFVSSSCDRGTPFWGLCRVDSLAVGESATITLVTTPITNPAKSERKFTNLAYIAEATIFDPNPQNNTASLSFQIVGNTH
jgi:large repetitive protein